MTADSNSTGPAPETPEVPSYASAEGGDLPAPSPSPSGGVGKAIARNTMANWAGHFVLLVSGFVLPRLVDEHIGRAQLGVWDFAWSTVMYMTMLNVGIASSVNRYVAFYRARDDWEGLNRSTSACAAIFTLTSSLAVVATLLLTAFLPRLLPESFAPYLSEARWLLFFIGLATAMGLALPSYLGVITGHQRYDIAAFIEAGCQVVTFISIATALLLGYGLKAMAVAVFASRVLEVVLVYVLAHRICPHLALSPRRVTWGEIWRVASFGSKFFLVHVSKLVLYQGSSLLIAFFLGPAVLAVYARSQALIMHANKFMFNFGRVFIPSASDLHAKGDSASLSRLALQGARYSSVIGLPVMLVLIILGDPLLRIWMGPDFAKVPVLAILALGHLAHQVQVGPFYALMGLDRHGRPSLAILVASALSVAVSFIILKYLGLRLVSVALSIGVSQAAANLLVLPLVVKRNLGIPLREYLGSILVPAVRVGVPFAGCLLLARYFSGGNDYIALAAGFSVGGAIFMLVSWCWELPREIKMRIANRLHMQWLRPA